MKVPPRASHQVVSCSFPHMLIYIQDQTHTWKGDLNLLPEAQMMKITETCCSFFLPSDYFGLLAGERDPIPFQSGSRRKWSWRSIHLFPVRPAHRPQHLLFIILAGSSDSAGCCCRGIDSSLWPDFPRKLINYLQQVCVLQGGGGARKPR